MPTALQHRRGTTTQHSTFTGAVGEITVDTTKKTAVVHDGTTAGGIPLAKESDIANTVRHDTSTQGLTTTQQSNARKNISALKDSGTNGIHVRTGSDATAARSIAAGAGISVSNGDGVNGNPTITNTGVTAINGQSGNVTLNLDFVPSVGGYTGAVTAAQLLAALTTVDGPTSGLDADTLDGLHASSFAPASGANYVGLDHGYSDIGSLCFGRTNANIGTVNAGGTRPGSQIYPAGIGINGSTLTVQGNIVYLTGTWRCLGYSSTGTTTSGATLWQRIA